jgi:hypothetical protein
MLATGSWSGGAKVWSVPNLNEVKNLRGEPSSSLSISLKAERETREC